LVFWIDCAILNLSNVGSYKLCVAVVMYVVIALT